MKGQRFKRIIREEIRNVLSEKAASYTVVWTDKDWKSHEKKFNSEREAKAFWKGLDAKRNGSEAGLWRTKKMVIDRME